ncbi:MAG TPA: DUF805 domain-containing protein [Noviherbaspirillum sp.]|nr:DUF805 domain-containing protein [Noviherbaspirillum sp.]
MMTGIPENFKRERRAGIFSLRGRLDRARYVAYSIGAIAGVFLVMALAGLALLLSASLGRMLYVVFSTAMLYGFLPVFFMILTIKRSHDFNMGGWLALLLLVPVVNLMFWFIPGTRGDNAFGPPPDPAPLGLKIAAIALPLLLVAGFLATSEVTPETSDEPPPSITLKPYTP